jgi:hypothetical protein
MIPAASTGTHLTGSLTVGEAKGGVTGEKESETESDSGVFDRRRATVDTDELFLGRLYDRRVATDAFQARVPDVAWVA